MFRLFTGQQPVQHLQKSWTVTVMNGNKGELESRPRVMTEKGLIYSLEQKLKARQSCYRKLSNLSDDVNELLSEIWRKVFYKI